MISFLVLSCQLQLVMAIIHAEFWILARCFGNLWDFSDGKFRYFVNFSTRDPANSLNLGVLSKFAGGEIKLSRLIFCQC